MTEPVMTNPSLEMTINEVRTLTKLAPGDILHVKMGIQDLGDNQGPWIPGPKEVAEMREAFEDVIPDGVQIVVTHFGVELQVLKPEGAPS